MQSKITKRKFLSNILKASFAIGFIPEIMHGFVQNNLLNNDLKSLSESKEYFHLIWSRYLNPNQTFGWEIATDLTFSKPLAQGEFSTHCNRAFIELPKICLPKNFFYRVKNLKSKDLQTGILFLKQIKTKQSNTCIDSCLISFYIKA